METRDEAPLPTTLDEVSVQLIFSDDTAALDVQIYVAALPPFILGIPSQQVQLYVAQSYLDRPDFDWDSIQVEANRFEGKESRVLPGKYHEYFINVYRRATLGHEGLPGCSLRFVSGHGFGTANIIDNHVKCGKLKERLRFAGIGGSATVLTVLDMCANPQVAACLANRVPATLAELKKWKPKEVFDNLPFALACSKSSTSWCCRVGFDGQHAIPPERPGRKPEFGKLSKQVCFPISNCILAAVKSRFFHDDNRSLDVIFADKFQQLKTRYLRNGPGDTKRLPQTHTELRHLQSLIDDGILPLKQSAFDCILFQREREWFPTTELSIILDNDANGIAVAAKIIEFVIKIITGWHSKDPKERFWAKVLDDNYTVNGETYKAWHMLLQMMVWHRWDGLLGSYYAVDDKTVLRCDNEDNSNVDLKELALYYPNLVDLVQHVQEWIETGETDQLQRLPV